MKKKPVKIHFKMVFFTSLYIYIYIDRAMEVYFKLNNMWTFNKCIDILLLIGYYK